MAICKDCKFVDYTQAGVFCRRMPPQMVAWPIDNQQPAQLFPYPTWPTVNPQIDWCGEWKAQR